MKRHILKKYLNPPFKGGLDCCKYLLLLAIVVTQLNVSRAQLSPNPTLDTNMSGESHVIKGRDHITFNPGFLYQIPEDEADKTFVAYFGYQELLLDIGGPLSSSSGFGISNSGEVGGTATSFDVGPSGAATYAIPIIVSPGTNEMEPNLSIVYNSQAPDGLLGKGFSLGGLSAIARGPATRYHDTQADQVDFDDQDRLLLDGVRLILVAGDYGKAGSEYRLENNRMAKVEAFGSLGNSNWATHFTVKEKSGLVKTYGLNADAQMVADIDGTNLGAYVWALVKVEDQASNFMTYQYINDGTEYRIDEVHYTGNTTAGLSTYAHVKFEYEERGTTNRTGFVYGHQTELTKRLKNIKSFYGSELVRDYRMAYDSYEHMPHLTSVTEYNSAGEHYNPILFDWNEEGLGLVTESGTRQITLMNGEQNQYQHTQELTGDFTGDGKTDLLVFYQLGAYNPNIDENATYEQWVLFEEEDGVMTQTQTGVDTHPGTTKYAGDFNGDGFTDYMAVTASLEFDIYFGNEFGFGTGFSGDLRTEKDVQFFQMADFDGDGKTDLLLFKYVTSSNRLYGDILYNDGAGFIGDKTWNAWEWTWALEEENNGLEFLLHDFNSDGKTDIYSGLYLYTDPEATESIEDGKALVLSNPTRWEFQEVNNADWPDFSDALTNQEATTGDFNGDGFLDILVTKRDQYHTIDNDVGDCSSCPDTVDYSCVAGRCIFHHNTTYWNLYQGTGNGFQSIRVNTVGNSDQPYNIGDFNGDSKTDLIQQLGTVVNIHVFDGSSTFAPLATMSLDDESEISIGDFTGNGTSDVLELEELQVTFEQTVTCGTGATPPTCELYRYSQPITLHSDYRKAPTMVKAIANSYGSRLYLDYQPLTNPDVYTKYQTTEAGGAEDLLDAQFPMHVVQSVYADNGLGSLAETRYHYEGALVHRFGKGYLGFQQIVVQDITQNIQTTQSYTINSAHRYVPLLSSTETTSLVTGNRISASTALYDDLDDGFPGTFLFAKSSETARTFDVYTDSELTSMTTDYSTYDSYGNIELMSTTYGSGHQTITENTYDYGGVSNWILGKLSAATVTKTAPGETNSIRTSSFSYNGNWFLSSETIQPGHDLELTTNYTYDGFGNILSTTTTGKVDDAGATQSRTLGLTFDMKGRFVESEANSLTHSASRTYDHAFGNLLTETGPNGLTTTYAYDNFGRLYQAIAPNTNIVATSNYGWVSGAGDAPDHARYYVDEITSGSPTVRTYYDRLNRPLRSRTTNWASQVVLDDTRYDGQGRVYKSSDPYFSGDTPLWTSREFDAIGRVTRIEAPGDRTTENIYTGLITTTRNAKGQETSARINMLGQQVRATDARGNSLTYTYRANGSLATISDFAGNVTSFTYDVLGNRTQVNDPDLGIVNTRYNGFGEVIWQQSARNFETTFEYDVLGRTTQRKIKKGSDEETTSWLYDTRKVGLLTSSSVGNISEEYFYDTYLRPIQVRESLEGEVYDIFQSYDGYGRLHNLTYPTGFAIQHQYTAQGYLEQVTSSDGTTIYWQKTQENARGQLEVFSLANGTFQSNRTFEKATGLLSQIMTEHGSEKLQNVYYEFDELNNLTKRTDYLADGNRGLEESFTYDNLNRLKTTSIKGKPYGQLSMDYDDLGNIISKSDVGTYSYTGARPHAVSEIVQSGTAIPIVTQDITYSGFEKVRTLTEGDASIHFTYGMGHDRKITTTTVAGVHFTKRFVGGLYEEEENHDGDKRKLHYISAGGEAIAIYTEDESQGTFDTHYLLKDHLGSLAAIADKNGNVIERYSYDAWGKRRDANTWDDLDGSTDVSYGRGFTGHEHLELFALVNMNGRMYDPVLGRFLSADPYTQSPDFTQGLNRYSYVFNNPVSFTDPSGYIAVGNFLPTFATNTYNFINTAVNGDLGDVAAYLVQHTKSSMIAVASYYTGNVVSSVFSSAFTVPGVIPGGLVGASERVVSNGITNWIGGKGFWDNWELNAVLGFMEGGVSGYSISKAQSKNTIWGIDVKAGTSPNSLIPGLGPLPEGTVEIGTLRSIPIDGDLFTHETAFEYFSQYESYLQGDLQAGVNLFFFANPPTATGAIYPVDDPFTGGFGAGIKTGAKALRQVAGRQIAARSSAPTFRSLGAAGRGFSKTINFGKIKVPAETFHRTIKPNILGKSGNFSKVVGRNPDIKIVGGRIRLTGTGPFKGKSFNTGLDASDFFGGF